MPSCLRICFVLLLFSVLAACHFDGEEADKQWGVDTVAMPDVLQPDTVQADSAQLHWPADTLRYNDTVALGLPPHTLPYDKVSPLGRPWAAHQLALRAARCFIVSVPPAAISPLRADSLPAVVLPLLYDEAALRAATPMPHLHPQPHIVFGLDNDFWDLTDYYYTNGVYISWRHPALVASPLARLLISHRHRGQEVHGIALVQNMYTGLKPKVDTLIPGDRPWAAYSMLGQFLYSYDAEHKRSHFSQISVGVLGPNSGGASMQTLAHKLIPSNSPPKGWDHQIAADILLDYRYQLRSLLYEHSHVESYALVGLRVGSLYDYMQWGVGVRYGRFSPFYQGPQAYGKGWRGRKLPLRFSVHMGANTKLVAYDASLQGGLLNRHSEYVLQADAVSRFVVEAQLGFLLSYGPWQLSCIQFWKSKTFATGLDHKYVRVRIGFGL